MPSSEAVRSRRAVREAAFQAVYQCVAGGSPITEAVEGALSRQRFTTEAEKFLRSLAAGAVTSVAELDGRYSGFLKGGWTPERLSLIDRLILRLAVFELWTYAEVPPKVTITEYVKLGKRFGSAESGSFINAVLGKVLEVSPKKDWQGGSEVREFGGLGEKEQEPEQEEEQGESWTVKSEE